MQKKIEFKHFIVFYVYFYAIHFFLYETLVSELLVSSIFCDAYSGESISQ